MKRITTTLFLIAILAITPARGESVDQYREKFYDSFIHEQISQWEPILIQMKSDPDCANLAGRQELLCGYYGYTAHLIDQKKEKEADKQLKIALELSKQLQELHLNDARLKALHGNLSGLRISLSPIRATTLAKGMFESINKAYELAPNDSWVSLLYGNIQFYIPSFLGGNKERGLACYQQALEIMEKEMPTYEHHWLYVQLQVTIGLVYADAGEYQKALTIYEQLMEKYPSYGFIKKVLYPQAQQGLKQGKKK